MKLDYVRKVLDIPKPPPAEATPPLKLRNPFLTMYEVIRIEDFILYYNICHRFSLLIYFQSIKKEREARLRLHKEITEGVEIPPPPPLQTLSANDISKASSTTSSPPTFSSHPKHSSRNGK